MPTQTVSGPAGHEDITLETVKKRTVSGVAVLTFRTVFLQIIGLLSFGIFGAVFSVPQLGTYSLVLIVKNFLSYFADVGLAGALIQKKNSLTEEDLKSTFLVQQTLVIIILSLLLFATPYLKEFYQWSQEAVFLLWAFGFSFFISSLRTIPTVLMERKLEFGKYVVPQIVDTIAFNVLAIYLATQGMGISSFTIAILVQAIVGLVLTYALQPWVPGFAFSKSSLKVLFKFGVPYQLNTFLAMAKDDGLLLVLGKILGDSFGLLTWAQKWGQAPLRFFMDQVIKVTFPAFSRLQDDKSELEHAVSRSILFVCLLVFPSLVGLWVLSPVIIDVIPRYEQWKPALFALSMFSVSAAFAAVTTPLTNTLNAIGKIKVTFYLMIMWTVLNWLLIPYLAISYGLNGAALGFALVSASSVVAIFVASRYVSFKLATPVFKPLVAAFVMATILSIVRGLMPATLQWVFVLVIFGLLIYFFSLLLLVGQIILLDAKKIIYAIVKK